MWRFAPVQKSGRKVKGTRKTPAMDKREVYLRQAEKAVKISFLDGLTKFKSNISADKLMEMYNKRDFAGIDQHIGWDKIEGALAPTKEAIAEAFDTSVDRAIETLGQDEVDPNYVATVQGRATQAKLKNRQRDYLTDLEDNKENIHQMIAQGVTDGRTPRSVALAIKSQIALTDTQQGAIDKFQQKLERQGVSPSAVARRVAAKERKSLAYRADMIAITETRVASAAAEQVVWQQQVKDGLLAKGTLRVWSAEPDACEAICRPMDGKTAKIDGTWTLPDNRKVNYVNESHPKCRCVQYLQDDDS